MKKKKILLAGLPSAGKTTFIAALWYYINSQTPNKKLTLNSLEKGEHEYLNTISQEWLSFSKVPRTNPSSSEVVSMNLKITSSDEVLILDIPDFSGEIFRDHFDNREWTLEFGSLLDEICGSILFINPDDAKNRPELVSDAIEAARILGEVAPTTNDNNKFVSWTPSHTSNQVKLVEHLQFIAFHKPGILPIKIAILISAWDKIETFVNPEITPEEWLEKHLPLLYQYLITNSELFNFAFYGVSAQGIDYGNEAEVDRLLNENPEDRILIKEGEFSSSDITKPIIWVSE